MDSGTYTEAWRRESVTIEPPFAQAWRTRRLLNHQIAADMAKEMKLTSWQKDPTSEGFLVALAKHRDDSLNLLSLLDSKALVVTMKGVGEIEGRHKMATVSRRRDL